MGLVRITGSMTSERCLELVEQKLMSYDLSLEADIISIVTDGASVMTKLGRLAPTFQQLCFAHGVQLAVVDVLYKNNDLALQDNSSEDSDSESEQTDDDNNEGGFIVERNPRKQDMTHEGLKPIIQKIRQIVRKVKRSLLMNEKLQKHIKNDFGKEMPLLLDCKTRWNSLVIMLQRFLEVENCIVKTLNDSNSDTLFEDWEWKRVSDAINPLQPLKVTVEALCRRDATLLTADTALRFALRKLQEDASGIALDISESLRTRIEQRRTDLSGLLQYLHTGSFESLEDDKDDLFSVPASAKLTNMIKIIIARLSHVGNERVQTAALETTNETDVCEEIPSKRKKQIDLQKELDAEIRKIATSAHSEASPQVTKTLLSTIKAEMKLFEGGGSRGFHLQTVYDHLLTIPATSVDSERAFSTAGYFCNKIRSSLKDSTLDDLSILRSHFLCNRE